MHLLYKMVIRARAVLLLLLLLTLIALFWCVTDRAGRVRQAYDRLL